MRRGSLFLPEVTMPLEELARHPRWAAAAQNNLGYALQRLGEREAGTARLEEAANAYRGALEAGARRSGDHLEEVEALLEKRRKK